MGQTTYGATGSDYQTAIPSDNTSHSQSSDGVDRAKGKAATAAETAREKTAEQAEDIKQQTLEAVETARRKAIEAADQAKHSGQQYAHQKIARVADEIGVFSDAIRKASGKLHDEQHDAIASYVDAAAEQIDHIRQSLQSKDIAELVDDLQTFTRRRPEVVYGGLFVAGLAAMRFLKASKPNRRPNSMSRNGEHGYPKRGYPSQTNVVAPGSDRVRPRPSSMEPTPSRSVPNTLGGGPVPSKRSPATPSPVGGIGTGVTKEATTNQKTTSKQQTADRRGGNS